MKKRLSTQLVIFYCLFLFSVLPAYSNSGRLQFTNLTTADGLSHKAVLCLLQDKQGFVWIGTADGLNRYDGYRFKKYYHNPNDSLSLGNNMVFSLADDHKGNIWVGTSSGFYCYTPQNEAFHQIHFPRGTDRVQPSSISTDEQGVVWGVDNGAVLLKMNAGSNRWIGEQIRLDSLLGYKGQLVNKVVYCLDGYVWICNNVGLVRYDSRSNTAELVSGCKLENPRIIRKGAKNEIIVAEWTHGIWRVNTKTKQVTAFPTQQIMAATKDIMGITDVLYEADGSLWVFGFPGFYKLSANGDITQFNKSTGYELDYEKLAFYAAMRDRDGNIWLGGREEGVLVVNRTSNLFSHYTPQEEQFRNQPAARVIALGEELIYTNMQGAYYGKTRKDCEQGRFTQIIDITVHAVCVYNANEFLLFTSNRVFVYNKKTNKLRLLVKTEFMQNGMVDSRGVVWITHWTQGLEGYDPKTGKRYQIDVDSNASRNIVFTLVEDANDGSLWLGTYGAGLVHVQNPTGTNRLITNYRHIEGANSISNDLVITMLDDARGSLWLGTSGGGLNSFNKKTKQFEVFNSSHGLKSNIIEAVICDKDGNIWFATSVISKYDVRKKSFTHFGLSEGVTGKYFNCSASCSNDGYLFFCDDKGVLSFNPLQLKTQQTNSMPILSDLRLFGQSVSAHQEWEQQVPLPKSISYCDTLRLPYNLNFFSIDFARSSFVGNKSASYMYRIDGLTNRWIVTAANEHSVSFNGLQAGTYRFSIKTSNGTGGWSKARSLVIIISSPWWKTWWFKIVFFICIASTITGLVYYRLHSLRGKNQQLEQVVNDRTQGLQQANQKLMQQSQMLELQAESLSEQNKTLSERQLFIEMKNAQLENALDTKDKLIHVIAHDFKNPLNAISGLSELLRANDNQLAPEKRIYYIDGIRSATLQLNTQMLTVLDWAQSQVVDVNYNPTDVNIEIVIDDAVQLVTESLRQKQININKQLDFTTAATVDSRMISTVFRNLLINAIKFTPRGGMITIIVQECDAVIEVSIVDTGIGMDAQKIATLFDSKPIASSYGTENEKGMGLGLQICKTFVEINRGTIQAQSMPHQGSVFIVALPKGTSQVVSTPIELADVLIESELFEPVFDRHERRTMLVIDDDPAMIGLLRGIFEPYFSVTTAFDGMSGMQLARNIVPTVIISDVQMPYTTGIELCLALKNDQMTSHIPILLISAESNSAFQQNSYLSGADVFVAKPFDGSLLLLQVKALLENRKKVTSKRQENKAQFKLPESYDDVLIKRVLAYIQENFCNSNIDINQVSENVGISRSQLWRKFKATVGYNPSEYLTHLRMQKAKEMLVTGKYKISEVAYDVGFTNPPYFTKCFFQYYGVTPRDFVGQLPNDAAGEA